MTDSANAVDQERLAVALGAVSDGAFVTDASTKIVYANDAFCDLIGLGRDDLIGQTPNLFKSPATRREVFVELWSKLEDGQTWKGRLLNRHFREGSTDGTFWSAVTITPLLDDRGRPEGFVSIQRDVTHEVRREEHDRRNLLRAEQGRRIGATLLSDAPLYDRVGRVLELLIGLSDAARPRKASLVLEETAGDRRLVRQARRPDDTALDLGTATDVIGRLISESPTDRGVTKVSLCRDHGCLAGLADSSPGHAHFATPLLHGGEPIGYLLVDTDPARPRDLETWDEILPATAELLAQAYIQDREHRQLQAERDKAIKTSESRQLFLASMSHEIRTPLNGVIGMTELLLSSSLDDEQLDHVRTLRSSAETLLALINDILDQAKIEAGKLRLESIPFDLAETIEDVAELLRTQAHDKGIEIIADIDPELPRTVRGDPVRVRQILTNLTSNAIKFTAEGEVVVSAQFDPETRATALSVQDTGIGIPADRLESVFDRYSQADLTTTRKFGGTGLGLAICRQLTELMHGTISAESTEGVGSCFTATLPLEPVEGVAREEGERPLEGRAVLVVDDNSTNRRVLRELLHRDGCRVIDAPDGPSALEWLGDNEDEDVDLVLLDMQMPEMSGLDVARRISVKPTLRGVPILILSSTNDEHAPDELERAGVSQNLLKPIRHRHLVRSMEVALREDPVEPSKPVVKDQLPHLGLHVLLAEDHIVNQKVATRILLKLGCTVDVAANGLEAVSMTSQRDYDVVLMDVQMPLMDGLTAARTIRDREEDGPRIPIVAMTAHALEEHRQACTAAGMDSHISKPFEMTQLIEILRDVCGSEPMEPTPSSSPPA